MLIYVLDTRSLWLCVWFKAEWERFGIQAAKVSCSTAPYWTLWEDVSVVFWLTFLTCSAAFIWVIFRLCHWVVMACYRRCHQFLQSPASSWLSSCFCSRKLFVNDPITLESSPSSLLRKCVSRKHRLVIKTILQRVREAKICGKLFLIILKPL